MMRNVGLLGCVGVVGVVGVLGLAGCGSVAVWSAPEKKAAAPAPEARAANDAFWAALHGGRYQDLPQVLDGLKAVYLKNPGDGETAAHIGFAHVWRLGESARVAPVPPTITDDIVLARKYFAEAVALQPDDARFRGFLASMEMAEGTVHGEEKLTRRGYYDLRDARDAWPEFNLFTLGYSMSRLPANDPKYRDALEAQWQNLDVCVEGKVDRAEPDYAKYMAMETREGRKRVCWNSWIAPHNLEGFFLNMGDMLVKAGDPATARKIYADARLSRTYDGWPYRAVLEERIAQADENVAVFRQAKPTDPTRALMVQSRFACMACHQN